MSNTTENDTQTAEEQEGTQENPRTVRSREKLHEACRLIFALLEGKGWVSSNEIHKRLAGKVSEGMFGRAKAALDIEHQRIRNEKTKKAEYQWRLKDGAKLPEEMVASK